MKRKFITDRLVEAGLERATHWGWPNIYTYTKSIGEQVIARSGLPFTIARPACCESTRRVPVPRLERGHQHDRAVPLHDDEGPAADPRAATCPSTSSPIDMVSRGHDPRARRAPRGHGDAGLPARRERHEPVHGAALRRARAASTSASTTSGKSDGNPLVNFAPGAASSRRSSTASRFERHGPAGDRAASTRGLASIMKKTRARARRRPRARARGRRRGARRRSATIHELFVPFIVDAERAVLLREHARGLRAPRAPRTARGSRGRPRRSTGPTG